MGPKIDMSDKLDNSPVSIKENGKLPKENLGFCETNCENHAFLDNYTITLEENLMMMHYTTNYREDNFFSKEVECDQEDIVFNGCKDDVDIVENVVCNEEKVVEQESLDGTENSSSFECSDSVTSSSRVGDDVEVESKKWDDDPWYSLLFDLDEFRDLFGNRKKVSSHWREFIRPLVWRCKWTELQIRKLHSQASTYDRKLAEYDQRKQYELDECNYGNLAVKTSPIHQNQSGKIVKRKKRKRVEETMDLEAYSSCHSLFSYYDNKRTSDDCAYLDEEHDNTGNTSNGELFFLEYKDSDPNAFDDILRNIEVTQMHVNQLKRRLDKVVIETPEIYIPSISGFGPVKPVASCGPSSCISNVNGENIRTVSLLKFSGDKNEDRIKEDVQPELVEHESDPNSSMRISASLGQWDESELNIMPVNKRKRGKRKARHSRWSL